MIRFLSEIKTLPIDPVFSNWVIFLSKSVIRNCPRSLKSFKAICFLFLNYVACFPSVFFF